MLLGLESIKMIAITASVQQFFSCFDSAGSRRMKRFWRRSLTCAHLCKSLAKLTGYEYGDEAYLAGLIHDIGELVFANNFPNEINAIVERAETLEQSLALEVESFGGHRYQAGAWLVSQWELESFMADAVFYQGAELEQIADAHRLVKILFVASRLARSTGQMDDPGVIAAEKLFDLNHTLIQGICDDALAQVVEAAKAMEIDIEAADKSMEDYQATVRDDEHKQIELAERVRNVALLDGMRQQLAKVDTEADVLETIQKSLNVLFGTRASGFFIVDANTQELQGQAGRVAKHSLSEFSLDLNSQSLIARCLAQGQTLTTQELAEDALVSVVDKQVATIFSAQHIICLPLKVNQQQLGVLVVPCVESLDVSRASQLRLLGMFANEASHYLLKAKQLMSQQTSQAMEERDYYHARAREVVHEVSNPLSIIKNYVHILSTKLEDQGVSDELNLIREELDRAGDILVKLPGITDRPTAESGAELINVNNVITDLLKVFRASTFVANRIESNTQLDEQMEAIACDRSALKQVLTNLIKNASEALPDAGHIVVSTQGRVNFNGKSFVEIVVEDNGPGIPDEVQANLFNPVETTKGGTHAGLGLAIVKNIIDDLGGNISCRSNAGSGTRFEILIPRILE